MTSALIVAALLSQAGFASPPKAHTLVLQPNCAARPEFRLKDGSQFSAGTAFEVKAPGGAQVVLTALHLFGPEGGLQSDLPPAKLHDLVAEVDLFNMDQTRRFGLAGQVLSRAGYPFPSRGADCRGDIVVFAASQKTGMQVLSLAGANPPVGTKIWFIGKAGDAQGSSPELYAAAVTEERPDAMVALPTAPFDSQGMSGCPAINAKGQVVGMELGWQEIDGEKHLLLNPVSSIRANLRKIH